MSRYMQLQKLLKQKDPTIDLSFYPDYLLNFRSILAEWVEQQDWVGTLCQSDETLTSQSQELLKEGLNLLQDRLKNGNSSTAGFEFHIRNTETQLKKVYESQPTKFVQDMHRCLNQEEQVVKTMISQDQAMSVDTSPEFHISSSKLSRLITHCRELDVRIVEVLNVGSLILKKWKAEVTSKSPTPRDVFGNGQLMSPPFAVFQKIKQELEQKSRLVIQEVNNSLTGLEWHIKLWKTQQLHECVSRTVESDPQEGTSYVETMCEQMCVCVNNLQKCVVSQNMHQVDATGDQSSAASPGIPTPSIVSWFSLALKDILKRVVELMLLVIKQPPLTMMIEKEKGQRDKEDVNNSKKFQTTIGILGGKGFGDSVVITDVEIYLAFNHDLAEAQKNNTKPQPMFKIHHDRCDSRHRYSSGCPDSPSLSYEKTYEKLRVEHFSRKETKHVYKQLYHVVYDVKIHFPLMLHEFRTQVLSFPIIVRTGANQASEHIGAQLWHSFNSLNVYDLNAEMAVSMKVPKVIQMVNQRILSIGCPGLRPYEQEFLRERLIMASSGKAEKGSAEPTVTLDNFIKDKVHLPRHGIDGAAKDQMDFSLWRWLHSIINLLEDRQTLHTPWVDGIIYGFASRQQCISALAGQRDGTFLLRFSESFLPGNHIMAKGGIAAVVQKEGQVVFAPPITSEEIEKDGLATMIKNIGCQFLLGTDLTINDLIEKYPGSTPPETSVMSRYFGWCKKEFIVPSDSRYDVENMHSPQFTSTNGNRVQPREQKPAKRRNPKTKQGSSGKMYRQGPPESPMSNTSSMPSPGVPRSPEWTPAPQRNGAQLQSQLSQQSQSSSGWGEPSGGNIPSMVLADVPPINQDPELGICQPGVEETMIVEMPAEEFQQLVTTHNIMDISNATVSSPSAVTTLMQNVTVSNMGGNTGCMIGSGDPNLQTAAGLQSQRGPLNDISLKELEEYLQMDAANCLPTSGQQHTLS